VDGQSPSVILVAWWGEQRTVGRKGMFLLAVSGSQHSTLNRSRAPAAAASDSLIPTSPSPCHVCISTVTTDTQTVQRGFAEAGMACSGVNYPKLGY